MSLPSYDGRGLARDLDDSTVTLPILVGAIVLACVLAAVVLAR